MRYARTSAIPERHRSLLGLIREANLSTRSLADRLGVSEPTVNRDIEFLREQGHQIKAVRVDRRWAYRLIEGTLAKDSLGHAGDKGR